MRSDRQYRYSRVEVQSNGAFYQRFKVVPRAAGARRKKWDFGAPMSDSIASHSPSANRGAAACGGRTAPLSVCTDLLWYTVPDLKDTPLDSESSEI